MKMEDYELMVWDVYHKWSDEDLEDTKQRMIYVDKYINPELRKEKLVKELEISLRVIDEIQSYRIDLKISNLLNESV